MKPLHPDNNMHCSIFVIFGRWNKPDYTRLIQSELNPGNIDKPFKVSEEDKRIALCLEADACYQYIKQINPAITVYFKPEDLMDHFLEYEKKHGR